MELRQREAPRSYPIPRAAERRGLRPGDLAKLVFLVDEPGELEGEKMWVEVESIDGEAFVGRLANEPRVVPLALGAEIRFRACHVGAVLFEPVDDAAQVIVSRRVLDDDAWPRRLVRELPSGEYSGWQVFAGDEPPGWAQDSGNARLVRVDEILARFPVLESVFGDSTPGEWRWSDAAVEYEPGG